MKVQIGRKQVSITPASKGLDTLRKEDNPMTYTKPVVSILGDASVLIETVQQKPISHKDGSETFLNAPAYDLDE